MNKEIKKVYTRAERKEIRRKLVDIRKGHQNKIGKFKYTKGAGTLPGEIHRVRLITPEHSDYDKYFNPDGSRKEITAEPIKDNSGKEFETNPQYWECNCEENYIHKIPNNYCPLCKAERRYQPDSRQNEIDEYYDSNTDEAQYNGDIEEEEINEVDNG